MRYLLFLFLCTSSMHALIVVGHRGAAGYKPENTLASFAHAIELGVDMIEFDVHVCASGQVVVIHDQEVDRTTNGVGLVKDMTLDQLQKLDAGGGEHIPTLQEVCDFVDRRVKINIELKGKYTVEKVAAIIEHYVQHKGWQYDDFLVSSLDNIDLGRFNVVCPRVPIAALFYTLNFTDWRRGIDRLSANIIVVCAREASIELVEHVHMCGKQLYVFSNQQDQIEDAIGFGVDAVISDYPRKIINSPLLT